MCVKVAVCWHTCACLAVWCVCVCVCTRVCEGEAEGEEKRGEKRREGKGGKKRRGERKKRIILIMTAKIGRKVRSLVIR